MDDLTLQVGREEFESIGPNGRLDGYLLTVALSKLALSYPGSLVLNTEKVCLATQPPPVAIFEQMSQQLLWELAESISSAKGQVFIPLLLNQLNDNDGHYVLAVVNNATGTVQYYDSLGAGSNNTTQSLVSKLLPKEVTYTHHHYRSPQQGATSNDCGVAVILSAVQLLIDPVLTDIDITPQSMYWLAGRSAILELCSGNAQSAEVIVEVDTALKKAITEVKKDLQEMPGEQGDVAQVLSSFVENTLYFPNRKV